jgi:hypothetical protein
MHDQLSTPSSLHCLSTCTYIFEVPCLSCLQEKEDEEQSSLLLGQHKERKKTKEKVACFYGSIDLSALVASQRIVYV